MTAAGQSSQSGMSIGSVLEQLRGDFPDVTISKIRFLESEGLVTPARTPSGYRRFSVGDCERLRFVLTAQRDHYLPLKVIKEQLEAIDSGGSVVSPIRQPRALAIAPGLVSPEAFRSDSQVRLTRADLCERAGVDDAFVTQLIRAGLIASGASGFFDEDSVTLATTVRDMADFGLEVRHLRSFKAAADREAGLVAQIAGPVARGRDAGARDRAEEIVRELAALSVTLHSCLVKTAVRGSLDG
ncbi:MAG: MerR family transcriptional regulator [Tomitella sp.]|nr:MerR family transcriptional regulator [Tomitella sp.]